MNKSERNEILKDIEFMARATITSLIEKKEWLSNTLDKIDELDELFSEVESPNTWDKDSIIKDTINILFATELYELHDMTYDFKLELDDHISKLSEARAEKLEEKYENLEEVIQSFEQDSQYYEDVETVIEHIEEAIEWIKEMRK